MTPLVLLQIVIFHQFFFYAYSETPAEKRQQVTKHDGAITTLDQLPIVKKLTKSNPNQIHDPVTIKNTSKELFLENANSGINMKITKYKIYEKKLKRSKRNLAQFGLMIRLMTQREPLLYNNYGNYCGWQEGSGRIVDDIDRCCHVHDDCYLRANKGICARHIVYASFISYWWYETPPNNTITCGSTNPCENFVCNCDKTAAECFAKHPFNPSLKKKSIFDPFIRLEFFFFFPEAFDSYVFFESEQNLFL